MSSKSDKKVVVLGTGGTIAGVAAASNDNIGYTAGQLGIGQMVASLPGLTGRRLHVVAEQVAQLDSKDMSFEFWQLLAQRCLHWLAVDDVAGVVVTHGTDTLEETAFFLHTALGHLACSSKPVVLTGAMRPASSIAPDGPQNLLDAIAVAAHAEASGVVVVFAGTLYGALDVQKVHPYRLAAFDAGDTGPMGYVEEGAVRLLRPWVGGAAASSAERGGRASDDGCTAALSLRGAWPRVEIIMNYAGTSGFVVNSLLAHGAAVGDPVRGIVVAATGNGSLHVDLEASLLRAQATGVKVIRATRCCQGRVLSNSASTLPDSQGLSPVKARIALMLDLISTAKATL